LFSSKNINKIFLSKKSKFDIKDKTDLILSPEFYWVRIFTVPVKTAKEALEVLPTLFEDILPLATFSYKAIKLSDEKYLSFAYNNDEILEHIKKSNLTFTQIGSVYFAQTELKEFSSFSIENSTYTYSEDELLLKIPNAFIQDAVNIEDNLNNLSFSNEKVDLKFYSNILDIKYLYKFSFLFLLFIIINIFRYSTYDKNIDLVAAKIDKIKQSYNMPQTMIQTNSIINKLQRKAKYEIKITQAMSYVLDFKKSIKKGTIEKISFKNKTLIIDFIDIDSSEIKQYLQKKYNISRNINKNNLTRIEMKI